MSLKELRAKRQALIAEAQELTGTITDDMPRERAVEIEERAAAKLDEADGLQAQISEMEMGAAQDDGEGAEIRALSNRSRLSSFVRSAISGNSIVGAEKELQDAAGIEERGPNGGVLVPWAALQETRADAATAAPSGGGQRQHLGIIGRVFARTATAFLGARMESVGMGEQSYIVLSGGVNPEVKAAGAGKDSEKATLSAVTLTPRRLTAAYTLRVEDIAKVPGFENGLRRDLADAIGAELDDQTINSASNPTGFFAALSDPSKPSKVADFGAYAQAGASGVDGKHANSLGEVRMLVGPQTYSHAGGLVASGTAQTAAAHLQEVTGGFQASDHVPAMDATSKTQQAILYRSGAMADADSLVALWEGLEIIRDPYSGASQGEVRITAISLFDFAVLRAAAYSKLAFKIA